MGATLKFRSRVIRNLKGISFKGDEDTTSVTRKVLGGIKEWTLYEAEKSGALPPGSHEIPRWVQNLGNILKKTTLRHAFGANRESGSEPYRKGYGLGIFRAAIKDVEARATILAREKVPAGTERALKKVSSDFFNDLMRSGAKRPNAAEIRKYVSWMWTDSSNKEASEFFRGIADALRDSQPQNNHYTDASRIHGWMMENWKEIDASPSVGAVTRQWYNSRSPPK